MHTQINVSMTVREYQSKIKVEWSIPLPYYIPPNPGTCNILNINIWGQGRWQTDGHYITAHEGQWESTVDWGSGWKVSIMFIDCDSNWRSLLEYTTT
ncbi:MAG: hypothetical protein GY774_34210 [Planctomycetes bacterium]|nr:hypothetical protein [Planctomycetota bacterium]